LIEDDGPSVDDLDWADFIDLPIEHLHGKGEHLRPADAIFELRGEERPLGGDVDRVFGIDRDASLARHQSGL